MNNTIKSCYRSGESSDIFHERGNKKKIEIIQTNLFNANTLRKNNRMYSFSKFQLFFEEYFKIFKEI